MDQLTDRELEALHAQLWSALCLGQPSTEEEQDLLASLAAIEAERMDRRAAPDA